GGRVGVGAMAPGDLIFFGPAGRRSRYGSITHMAIALGDGWIVQSSGSRDGVSITRLASYWPAGVAFARPPAPGGPPGPAPPRPRPRPSRRRRPRRLPRRCRWASPRRPPRTASRSVRGGPALLGPGRHAAGHHHPLAPGVGGLVRPHGGPSPELVARAR